MTLIFIDGPLAEETKPWPDAPPTFDVLLPKRATSCYCNPDVEDEFESQAETFRYYRVMLGRSTGLYSKHDNDEEAVLKALKSWVITDLSKDWHVDCRARRAWQ